MGEVIEAELENILLKDPHLVKIHESKKYDALSINYDLFKEGNKDHLDNLQKYLSLKCIEDDFKDHKLRRVWECDICETHEDMHSYIMDNAFKETRFASVESSLYFLKDQYIGPNKEEYNKLVDGIYNEIKPVTRSIPERLNMVERAKEKVYDLLVFLRM